MDDPSGAVYAAGEGDRRVQGPLIVLFDGVCNFCHASVQFIIDRDPQDRFRFAPLQSSLGEKLLTHFDLGRQKIVSVVLVESGRCYVKSTAALRIARHLRRPWPLVALLIMLPVGLRDLAYDWFARNRYRWFGRSDQCRMPTPQLQRRFLDTAGPKDA
jgi:predicted DCC family thiol-disulfide oxidoreductase YuxK